jgi:dGTPase
MAPLAETDSREADVGGELCDYDWYCDHEVDRYHAGRPGQDPGDERSPFERDRARIIHSVAFRRLQGKTQIFASGWADYLRTRVTHSIEVAQIGRNLALRFGVPESLVEAACLGHDLGHPPFGHTGEQALDECMANHGRFEGNAQTFRIVTQLEEKSVNFNGLDLTRATLLGLLKYPYLRSAQHKKFLYQVDAGHYGAWLFDGVEHTLIDEQNHDGRPPRTVVCDLMDWADDVAYSVHDLEDGLAAGILRPEFWTDDRFVESIWRNVNGADVRWRQGPPSRDTVAAILERAKERFVELRPTLPADVIREVSRHYINKFAIAGGLEVQGDGRSLFDYRFEPGEEIRVENQVLKAITFEYVVKDERTTTFVYKGARIVRQLWETLFENTQDGKDRFELFPREMRDELDGDRDNQTELARRVCDYIAGMTEGQAIQLYGRLFESSPGSPFTLA